MTQRRLLVFGDRNWRGFDSIRREIERRAPDVVIHGCARGADTIGGAIAEELGIEVERYPAQWDKYGRAAGPIRNKQMLVEGQPTEAIGFHPDLKQSKGSADMFRRCQRAGIPVEMFDQ